MENNVTSNSDFRKKFLEIPFGLLSGISTSFSSAVFLIILFSLNLLNVKGLDLNRLSFYYILTIIIDGFVYHYISQRRVRALYPNLSQKSKIYLIPNKDPNTYLACLTFITDALPEIILLRQCVEFNMNITMAFGCLVSAKMVGGLFLGWISDITRLKNTLLITMAVSLLCVLIFEYAELFGLTINQSTIFKALVFKGLFGCGFVLAKSSIALSAKIEIKGDVAHEGC